MTLIESKTPGVFIRGAEDTQGARMECEGVHENV